MPELPGKPAGNACVMKDNAVPTQGTKDHIRAWLPVRRHRSGGEWLTIVAQNDPMARPPDGSGPIQRRTHSTDGGGSGLVQHVLRLPARTPPWNPHERELCAAPVSVKRCTLSHIGQPHGSGADLLLFQSQDRLADNSEWDEWRLLRCHVGQFLGSALCSAVGDWSLLGSRSPTQESGSSPTVRTPRRVYGSRS